MTIVRVSDLIQATSERFKIPVPELLGERRMDRISKPRQLAMYLARTQANKSLEFIGSAFGRHHTTVMQGIRAVKRRLAEEVEWVHHHNAVGRRAREIAEERHNGVVKAFSDSLMLP